jgi:hypothetical protein
VGIPVRWKEGGERVWEGEYCKYCVNMYVNGKMRPTETTTGMGEGDKGEWQMG